MRHQLGQVEAVVVEDAAGVVLRGDDLGAGLGEQLGRRRAHVAEALHRHARAVQVQADAARRFAPGDEHAAAGGLHAAQAAAQVDGLAGDHAGGGGAGVHRVGVHHPRHDLRVGVHVGRRDVLLRADDDADLAGVAARQPLQLLQRQLLRVDADAALGAAEGQVDGGVLDAHPGRQRHHLFQRHVGVVAHAALAGAARQAVLHAVALEVRDAAVVQLDRDVDDQRALGALAASRPSAPGGPGRARRGRPASGRCPRGCRRWGGRRTGFVHRRSPLGLRLRAAGRRMGPAAARVSGGPARRQHGPHCRGGKAAECVPSAMPGLHGLRALASWHGLLQAAPPGPGYTGRMNQTTSPSSAAATWPAPSSAVWSRPAGQPLRSSSSSPSRPSATSCPGLRRPRAGRGRCAPGHRPPPWCGPSSRSLSPRPPRPVPLHVRPGACSSA
jgi:hypothetical protein